MGSPVVGKVEMSCRETPLSKTGVKKLRQSRFRRVLTHLLALGFAAITVKSVSLGDATTLGSVFRPGGTERDIH
ncbi:hypothetical protein [Mycobacterium leprae]|nr:hypothetical protein [Mycobacterium leprae]